MTAGPASECLRRATHYSARGIEAARPRRCAPRFTRARSGTCRTRTNGKEKRLFKSASSCKVSHRAEHAARRASARLQRRLPERRFHSRFYTNPRLQARVLPARSGNGDHSDRADVRFARPNIQIYDAHVADLYQWVCGRYLVGVCVADQASQGASPIAAGNVTSHQRARACVALIHPHRRLLQHNPPKEVVRL